MELICPTTCTCLFMLRPGVLSKTLSHMWGKVNLPMFLFNVGLLTLMNMNSLRQASTQADSTVQAASASLPQTASSQGGNTISQGYSAVPPQAGSSLAISNGTNSQGDSTIPPQAGSSWTEGADAQASSTSPQALSTNFQGVSTTPSSQANNANRSPNDNSLEDPNPKLVVHLSSKPLTHTQRSVLAKGPNFVVTPRHPPNLEYIMAIESVCIKLGQQDAEELRTEINRVLRSSQPP